MGLSMVQERLLKKAAAVVLSDPTFPGLFK